MSLTNRDPDVRHESPAQSFRSFRDEMLKQVHTSIPGIVQSYDAATQRARVQPAVDLWLRDGRTIPKAIILDVPVMWPGGGGFLIHAPLETGDAILLAFSERDIQGFKERLERGAPPSDRVMAVQDAVALPVFLPQATSLATDTGLTIQNEAGTVSIVVEGDTITITGGNVTIAGTTTVNGQRVADAGAGTGSAAGPGSHSHGLTAA